MKKKLKAIIIATSIAAVAGIGAVSFAAWSANGAASRGTANGGVGGVTVQGDGTVKIQYFKDGSGVGTASDSVSVADKLVPWNQALTGTVGGVALTTPTGGDNVNYMVFQVTGGPVDAVYKISGELTKGSSPEELGTATLMYKTSATKPDYTADGSELSISGFSAISSGNTVMTDFANTNYVTVILNATGMDAVGYDWNLTFTAEEKTSSTATIYKKDEAFLVGAFGDNVTTDDFMWNEGFAMTKSAEADKNEWSITKELKAGEIVKIRLNNDGIGYAGIKDACWAKGNFETDADDNIVVKTAGTYTFYFKPDAAAADDKLWVEGESYYKVGTGEATAITKIATDPAAENMDAQYVITSVTLAKGATLSVFIDNRQVNLMTDSGCLGFTSNNGSGNGAPSLTVSDAGTYVIYIKHYENDTKWMVYAEPTAAAANA